MKKTPIFTLVATVSLSACNSGLECGEGTLEKEGVCVADTGSDADADTDTDTGSTGGGGNGGGNSQFPGSNTNDSGGCACSASTSASGSLFWLCLLPLALLRRRP